MDEGVVGIPPKSKTLDITLPTYGPGTGWFDRAKAEYVPDTTEVTKIGR